MLSFFKRYGLVVCAVAYTAALMGWHALGCFPAPSSYDLSKLVGSPNLIVEGQVINFPQTRWNQTRFVMEGRSTLLTAFSGRIVVNLNFPLTDLAPGETLRVRGWLSPTRLPTRKRPFNERNNSVRPRSKNTK